MASMILSPESDVKRVSIDDNRLTSIPIESNMIHS